MKIILISAVFLNFNVYASVVGISTHPLNEQGRLISAEITGHMSQRNEMASGLRYTQEVGQNKILDVTASGGQYSRGLNLGTGMDFALLNENISNPRISIKPYLQFLKFDNQSSNLLGAAPIIRKGVSLKGQEFFPYLAIPSGLKIDSTTDEFVYYSSMTLGASLPFPGANNDKVLLSVEGNKNLGASSDYVGCLVSWIWK